MCLFCGKAVNFCSWVSYNLVARPLLPCLTNNHNYLPAMNGILFLFILFLVVTGLLSTSASTASTEDEKAEKEPHFCKECGSEIFDEEDGETHNHKFIFQIMAVGNPRQMKSLRQLLVPNAKGTTFSAKPDQA